MIFVKSKQGKANDVGKSPTDRNGPPDRCYAESVGKRIGKRDTCTKRDYCQHDRNTRLGNRAIKSIKQKEKSDADIERAFDAKITYALSKYGGFRCINKDREKRFCEDKNENGNGKGKGCGSDYCAFQAFLDTFLFACAKRAA